MAIMEVNLGYTAQKSRIKSLLVISLSREQGGTKSIYVGRKGKENRPIECSPERGNGGHGHFFMALGPPH